MPISYFFGELSTTDAEVSAEDKTRSEQFERPETIDLVRFYYAIPDPTVRHQFLELAKAVVQSAKQGR